MMTLAALALAAAVSAPHPQSTPAPTFVRQCQGQAAYVTQSTAWARWREAQLLAARMGPAYGVSSGVFPCYATSSRGYCFNYFYPC
jgi:hypothetical protein